MPSPMADWPMQSWGYKWRDIDIEKAVEMSKTHTVYDIGKVLGRSPAAILAKLRRLGFSAKSDRWQNRLRFSRGKTLDEKREDAKERMRRIRAQRKAM